MHGIARVQFAILELVSPSGSIQPKIGPIRRNPGILTYLFGV